MEQQQQQQSSEKVLVLKGEQQQRGESFNTTTTSVSTEKETVVEATSTMEPQGLSSATTATTRATAEAASSMASSTSSSSSSSSVARNDGLALEIENAADMALSYVRTRHKNMRCFPKCSAIHKTKSFCGQSLYVSVKGQVFKKEEVIVVGEFRNTRTHPSFSIGQVVSNTEFGESYTEGVLLKQTGSVMSFAINPVRKWKFDGKLRPMDHYVFSVFLIVGLKVLATTDSPSFSIIPIWKTPGEEGEEGDEEVEENRRSAPKPRKALKRKIEDTPRDSHREMSATVSGFPPNSSSQTVPQQPFPFQVGSLPKGAGVQPAHLDLAALAQLQQQQQQQAMMAALPFFSMNQMQFSSIQPSTQPSTFPHGPWGVQVSSSHDRTQQAQLSAQFSGARQGQPPLTYVDPTAFGNGDAYWSRMMASNPVLAAMMFRARQAQ